MYNLNGNDGQQITNLILDAVADRQDLPRRDHQLERPDHRQQSTRSSRVTCPTRRSSPSTGRTPRVRTTCCPTTCSTRTMPSSWRTDRIQLGRTRTSRRPPGPCRPRASNPSPTSTRDGAQRQPGWPVGLGQRRQLRGRRVQPRLHHLRGDGLRQGAQLPGGLALTTPAAQAVQPTSLNVATALEAAILHADLTQDLTNVYTNPLPTPIRCRPTATWSPRVRRSSPPPRAPTAPRSRPRGAPDQSHVASRPQKGQALGQFVAFLACAGQEKMALLGYSPLPPNLVQEDFNAIGRLNGGQEPPPVSAANCKNPYVDGQIPLPGEPPVQGAPRASVAAAAVVVVAAAGPGVEPRPAAVRRPAGPVVRPPAGPVVRPPAGPVVRPPEGSSVRLPPRAGSRRPRRRPGTPSSTAGSCRPEPRWRVPPSTRGSTRSRPPSNPWRRPTCSPTSVGRCSSSPSYSVPPSSG